jgi:hypothetical protein
MVAAIDPFRMIDAPAPISGKAAWTVRKTAVTWVRKTSSKSFFQGLLDRTEFRDPGIGKQGCRDGRIRS